MDINEMRQEEKKYAAIVIPTLCRYDCLCRCIFSLKNNSLANETDIYIGVDAPYKEEQVENNQKIIEFLKELEGFRNKHIIIHEKNVGSSNNISTLVKLVREENDRYITIEDDVQVSPNYLEFVNKILDKYESDENFIAVGGHALPAYLQEGDYTVYRSYHYFSGMASGKLIKTIDHLSEQINKDTLKYFYKDHRFIKRLMKESPNQFCNFVKGMLGYTTPDLISAPIIDITIGIYMAYNMSYTVLPHINKCRNWGYASGGEHCETIEYDIEKPLSHRNYDFSIQDLDKESEFGDIIEPNNVNESIMESYNSFYSIPKNEYSKTVKVYYFSQILGITVSRFIIRILKQILN